MKTIWNSMRKGLLLVGVLAFLAACGKEEKNAVTVEPESLQMAETEAGSQQSTKDTEAAVDETDNAEAVSVPGGNSLVGLSFENQTKKVSGSGFIAELTEDAVYICTNQHVIKDSNAWTVTFANGTSAEGKKVGCSQVFDVGVVMVKKDEIAQETLDVLETVKVDLNEWVRVRDAETKHVPIKVYRIGEEGVTGECLEGTIESLMAYFENGNGLNHTKMDITLENGDSGSAVFDENGNLFAMVMGASYTSEKKPTRWGIPLTALITSYKEITGRDWITMF